MKDWEQIRQLLGNKGVSENDANLVRNFLLFFPFNDRQRLMGIFLGFPDKVLFLIGLLKQKKELMANFSDKEANSILNKEKDFVNKLIKDLENNV